MAPGVNWMGLPVLKCGGDARCAGELAAESSGVGKMYFERLVLVLSSVNADGKVSSSVLIMGLGSRYVSLGKELMKLRVISSGTHSLAVGSNYVGMK